jgi:hypothetical protein
MRNSNRLQRRVGWALAVLPILAVISIARAQAPAPAQGDLSPGSYKSAIVVLVDDARLRTEMEDSLVAKARSHGFDAMASHLQVADVRDFTGVATPPALRSQGVNVVVMLRPAAVGAGASLESVRDSLPAGLYSQMREFASHSSGVDTDELIAVVHVAIYSVARDEPRLVTAGAVWLSEPVASRQEGIERLEDMLLQNVEAARAQIRSHLDEAASR